MVIKRTRAMIEQDDPLIVCFHGLYTKGGDVGLDWVDKRKKWRWLIDRGNRLLGPVFGWDFLNYAASLRLVLRTPAGQRFEDLAFEYLSWKLKREQKRAAPEEVNPVLQELRPILKELWLEAHSQADLVLDMEQLSEEALNKAEAAAAYVRELTAARQEIEERDTQLLSLCI